MSDKPPMSPEVVARLEALVAESRDAPDVARKLEYILEALIVGGQLPARLRRVLANIQADKPPKVRLAVIDHKRMVETSEVPCAELIPICGARCCGFTVVLSEEDVREGKLPFELHEPYVLERDRATKLCKCLRADGGCGAYEYRPAACRSFDCREDRRIWLDYENKILAPAPEPDISFRKI